MIGWRTECGKNRSEMHAWMQRQIIQVAGKILEAPLLHTMGLWHGFTVSFLHSIWLLGPPCLQHLETLRFYSTTGI